MTNQTKPEALSRTWSARVDYRVCGENWGSETYTVTLFREFVGGPLSATIDGQPAEAEKAIRILRSAEQDGNTPEVLAEVLADPTPPAPLQLPPPVIGKARAHQLHKIMGALGMPRAQHYGVAAYAIDEPFPLTSLSTLTDDEATRVWAHLCRTYSNAREVAQRIKAKTARAA